MKIQYNNFIFKKYPCQYIFFLIHERNYIRIPFHILIKWPYPNINHFLSFVDTIHSTHTQISRSARWQLMNDSQAAAGQTSFKLDGGRTCRVSFRSPLSYNSTIRSKLETFGPWQIPPQSD